MLRSWTLLRDKSDAKPELLVRLSTRLAKALCHGARAGRITREYLAAHAADIQQLHESATSTSSTAPSTELSKVWEEWEGMQTEVSDYIAKGPACLSGLSHLPLFCKPLYVLTPSRTIHPYSPLCRAAIPPRSSFRYVHPSVCMILTLIRNNPDRYRRYHRLN